MKFIKIFITIIFLMGFIVSGHSQNTNEFSSTVEFKVNTNEFVMNQNYNDFVYGLVPYVIRYSKDIDYIVLIGSASPEGNAKANIRLAERRAEMIYSYINKYISRNKIIINNDYNLFLTKTGYDESDYTKLRATYIEIHLNEDIEPEHKTDTLYIERKDTFYIEKKDTVYRYKEMFIEDGYHTIGTPVFAVYNNLLGDFIVRGNIGAEIYFQKMSFFFDASFSNRELFGKTYNIDLWYTGFRKYFNYDYDGVFIEAYGNAGYFDTELFSDIGKIGVAYGGGIGLGYAFDLCPHWKICPMFRIGLYEQIYFADYYYTESGNINVIFGNYVNGKTNSTSSKQTDVSEANVIMTSKTITKEFYNNSNRAFYVGPTYIGIILKRDFCINYKKHKTKF